MNQSVARFCLAAFLAIFSQSAQADNLQTVSIAAGNVSGGYFQSALDLAQALGQPATCPHNPDCGGVRLDATIEPSSNVTAALKKLRVGVVGAALVPAANAFDAYNGTAGSPADKSLRLVANLPPVPLMIIARADTPARSLSDLAGRRVLMNTLQADQSELLQNILALLGLPRGRYAVVMASSASQILERLQRGRADAAILQTSTLDPVLQDALIKGQIVLVTPGKGEQQRALSRFSYFSQVDLPVYGTGTYRTLQMPLSLVVSAGTSAELVRAMLTRLDLDGAESKVFSRATAVQTPPIPLHDAAKKFYDNATAPEINNARQP